MPSSPWEVVSDADLEEQAQELEALEAIYGSDVKMLSQQPLRIEVSVPIALPQAVRLEVPFDVLRMSISSDEPPASASEGAPDKGTIDTQPEVLRLAETVLQRRSGNANTQFIENCADGSLLSSRLVRHLPPLLLEAEFGPGYPSTRQPTYLVTAPWARQAKLSQLCEELDGIWQPGSPVIFSWVAWLQERAQSAMELCSEGGRLQLELRDSSRCLVAGALAGLANARRGLSDLLSCDEALARQAWEARVHRCQLCLSDQSGAAFMDLADCGHPFCADCVAEMFRVHLDTGRVSDIRCPQVDCRCRAVPSVAKRVLDDESYDKWHRLEIQAIVQEMPSLVFCPRCEHLGDETPVVPQQATDDEPLLAQCDKCTYVFCPDCREAYHPQRACGSGDQDVDRKRVQQQLACASKSKRLQLMEELESLKLIQSSAMPCPKCKVAVHRTEGCNHMNCSVCRTHFCYRCGTDITSVGYGHFGTDSCPTFDRDFDLRVNSRKKRATPAAVEEELEQLRILFPDDVKLIDGHMAGRPLARRREHGDSLCIRCRHWTPRAGTNNHVRCQLCKAQWCFLCSRDLSGCAGNHFGKASGCPQHTRLLEPAELAAMKAPGPAPRLAAAAATEPRPPPVRPAGRRQRRP